MTVDLESRHAAAVVFVVINPDLREQLARIWVNAGVTCEFNPHIASAHYGLPTAHFSKFVKLTWL